MFLIVFSQNKCIFAIRENNAVKFPLIHIINIKNELYEK